jgi:hypothetical protein
MFRRDRADIDRQIDTCGPHVFAEIDIGAWQ